MQDIWIPFCVSLTQSCSSQRQVYCALQHMRVNIGEMPPTVTLIAIYI